MGHLFLDRVLFVLFCQEGEMLLEAIKNQLSLLEHEKEHNIYMINSALNKMVRDGYVIEHINDASEKTLNKVTREYKLSTFQISFDGIYFFNSGGYEAQQEMIQKREIENGRIAVEQARQMKVQANQQRQILFLNWVLCVVGFFAALESIANIFAFYGIKFVDLPKYVLWFS